MQISRLFEIVYILMNKKNTTAKELSEHFEVSQRTIYRDIETLCQARIPIYTSKGKGGGIGLLENFVLNKSLLSEQEQNDILTALQGLKATNYSDSDQILTKLNSLFGNKTADWIEVDFSYWSSNEEDKSKFRDMKVAILDHRVLQFEYYNSKGEETHRSIEPRKMMFKGQAWYLYGFCREKKDFRYFKISRIKSLKISEEIFFISSNEKINEEIPKQIPVNMLQVKLKIDSEMAFRVFDEFPPEAIEKNSDGSFLIHTQFQFGSWLYGYLMSYEDHIEILEPIDIRDHIISIYKNTLSKYRI